jgi:hypothetical protein
MIRKEMPKNKKNSTPRVSKKRQKEMGNLELMASPEAYFPGVEKRNMEFALRNHMRWVGKYARRRRGPWVTEMDVAKKRVKHKETRKREGVRGGGQAMVVESGVRERGPRRRREIRLWGTELGGNKRPTEKRRQRSLGETRGRGVFHVTNSKGRIWWEVEYRESEAERRGIRPDNAAKEGNPRSCGEAATRYVDCIRKAHPTMRRAEQRHDRRLHRENEERAGGHTLVELVRNTFGMRITARGEGLGVHIEGKGRKSYREISRREKGSAWGQSALGRKPIVRDGIGVGHRRPKKRRAVWRTKEQMGMTHGRGRASQGNKKRALILEEVTSCLNILAGYSSVGQGTVRGCESRFTIIQNKQVFVAMKHLDHVRGERRFSDVPDPLRE